MAAVEGDVMEMMSSRRFSRRRLLKAGIAAGTAMVAGCSGRADPVTTSSTPSPPTRSVFREVSFEGGHMVVRLREGHEVSQVNLIAPDGSVWERASVAEGATTIRLRILDIEPDGGGYEHYTPGRHELVAVSDAGSESMEIELSPELRIVDVRQYREGTEANDYGKLAVVVENKGTAPTWVYDITNQNAPNFAANTELGDDPGILLLDHPNSPDETIILPNGSQTFVGVTLPLLFSNQDSQTCGGQVEMAVIAGSPALDPLQQHVQVTIGGETESSGLAGEYTCTDILVKMPGEGGSNG